MAASITECAACMEPYTPTRPPISFTCCGHSICHRCSPPSSESSSLSLHECPTCGRQSTTLVPNSALAEALQTLTCQTNPSAGAICGSARHGEEEGAPDATLWCAKCDSFLCDECAGIIHSILPSHATVSANARPPPDVMCRHHTNQVVSLLCCEESCADDPLICFVCDSKHGSHEGHATETLEVGQERRKDEIRSLHDQLVRGMAAAENSSCETLSALTRMSPDLLVSTGQDGPSEGMVGSVDRARNEITCFFDELIHALTARRDAMLDQLGALHGACEQRAGAHFSQLGQFLSAAHVAAALTNLATSAEGNAFLDVYLVAKAGVNNALALLQALDTSVPITSTFSVSFPPLDPSSFGLVQNLPPPPPGPSFSMTWTSVDGSLDDDCLTYSVPRRKKGSSAWSKSQSNQMVAIRIGPCLPTTGVFYVKIEAVGKDGATFGLGVHGKKRPKTSGSSLRVICSNSGFSSLPSPTLPGTYVLRWNADKHEIAIRREGWEEVQVTVKTCTTWWFHVLASTGTCITLLPTTRADEF